MNVLLARSLRRRFDRWLDTPRAYAEQLLQQKSAYSFPESDIMPCVFPPLLAYASRACERGRNNPDDLRRMSALVELARDAAIRRVGPPRGDLERLCDYRRHSVYLGLLNLALTAFRWSTGDQRFARLQEHLCSLP